MTLSQYLDLLRGQGLADRTVAEYCKYIRRAMTYADGLGVSLAGMAPHEVRTFADACLPCSWATRKQARTALARYFIAAGRTDEPWRAIRVPRKPRPTYTGLEPSDAARLKQAADLHGGRPGLATLCLLYTGARPSEVAGFHHDYIGGGMIAWWRSKTSEWHALPLHPVLAAELEGGTGYVFTGDRGRAHVQGSTIWRWCRQVAATVGLEVTPKQVRSTVGMMVLESTRDLDAAASLLGHRSVDVTRAHYVRTSGTRMVAAVESLDY